MCTCLCNYTCVYMYHTYSCICTHVPTCVYALHIYMHMCQHVCTTHIHAYVPTFLYLHVDWESGSWTSCFFTLSNSSSAPPLKQTGVLLFMALCSVFCSSGVIDCMLLTFENKSSDHALGRFSCVESFITIHEQLQ